MAYGWSNFTNIACNSVINVLSNDTNLGTVSGGGISSTVIYAMSKAGSTFRGWSDNNMDNPRTITVTNDTTLTANFVADSSTIFKNQIASLKLDTASCNQNTAVLQQTIVDLQRDIILLNSQLHNASNSISVLQSDLDACEADKANLQALLDSCSQGSNGIKSPSSGSLLRIYPNPVNSGGVLYIDGETLQLGDKIEIFDMQGKLIFINYASGKETAIKIEDLPVGTYLLRLAGKRGVKFEVK
jgi:hypothetical protein